MFTLNAGAIAAAVTIQQRRNREEQTAEWQQRGGPAEFLNWADATLAGWRAIENKPQPTHELDLSDARLPLDWGQAVLATPLILNSLKESLNRSGLDYSLVSWDRDFDGKSLGRLVVGVSITEPFRTLGGELKSFLTGRPKREFLITANEQTGQCSLLQDRARVVPESLTRGLGTRLNRYYTEQIVGNDEWGYQDSSELQQGYRNWQTRWQLAMATLPEWEEMYHVGSVDSLKAVFETAIKDLRDQLKG